MSLINDALKKAQRQRTEGSTPATEISTPNDPQEPLHRVARREKPVGFRSQLILVAGGAVAAVVLLGVGAFFFFRPAAETSVPASPRPTQVASAPAPAASVPVPAAVAPAPAVPESAPAAALPIVVPASVSPAQPTPTAVVAATSPSPAPVEASAVPPATTPPAAAPVAYSIPNPAPVVSTAAAPSAPAITAPAPSEKPKPSTRMIGVIEHLKVGGIRVAGPESKVLMNDRVYRINDVIDFELGIRLTGIEAKALTFEDSRGAVHVRTF